MTGERRAAVASASFVLEHVPDLVRYGSKPAREPDQLERLTGALRSFDDAVAYPPNQVFVGNLMPEDLWERPRTWWEHPVQDASATGRFGDLMPQADFYALLAEVDRFDLVHMGAEPAAGELAIRTGRPDRGLVRRAITSPTSRSPPTCCWRTWRSRRAGSTPSETCCREPASTPRSITHAIGCGEEAVGDRYQRGRRQRRRRRSRRNAGSIVRARST